MNKFGYIVILLLTGLSGQAQLPLNLTLDRCRTLALENSTTLKKADETLNKARGEKMAARSAWFPNISATATGVYSHNEISKDLYLPTQVFDPLTGELVPNVAINPLTGEPIMGPDGNPVFASYAYLPLDITLQGGGVAGVKADQPIYAGGRIGAGNKMARLGEEMAQTNRMLQQAEILYKTDQAYYQYLSVKEKVVLANQYLQLLDQLAQVVQNSYETGMTHQNEWLKVQVKRNEAQIGVQEAENGLQLAGMALCQVMGIAVDTPLEINDSLTAGSLPFDSLPELQLNNRLEARLLNGQVELAEQQVRLVRGNYLPTAGISVGYNYYTLALQDADNFSHSGLMALGSVKIPLTTFGEGAGKMKAAKADYQMKQLERDETEALLQLEQKQVQLNYQTACHRVQLSTDALAQAAENRRIRNDRYELGLETLADLLEAQAEWQKAYSDRVDAVTRLKIQESNYRRIAGQIAP